MIQKIMYITCIAFLIIGCETKSSSTEEPLSTYIDAIKTTYAPDKRVALFDVHSKSVQGEIILTGMTTIPEALADLKSKLDQDNIAYVDSIEQLPTQELMHTQDGVIKISVANLRSNPKHSAELATQATLGTPVKVYKRISNWYLIQTPDHYLAWVDSGGLSLLNKEQYERWGKASKVIYLGISGVSYEEPTSRAQIVSDVVAGNIFELLETIDGFYKIAYPDGRIAYLEKDNVMPYDQWLSNLHPTEDQLVNIGKKMMGTPYLWGGTSSKGVDCSGFTKTIYFLNGMVIPRDASQQIHTGILVDDQKDFSKLQPGDLLFFGTPASNKAKERVVHVGMWIGNNQFIHSSGRVHISSMDPNAENYDAYNLQRYLRSKRLLNQPDPNIIDLTNSAVFKN